MSYTLNWPGVWVVVIIFVLLNWRGVLLYRRGYSAALFGLGSLWAMAVLVVVMVYRLVHP